MATTQFLMTMDGQDSSYPQDLGQVGAGTNSGQNIGRYSTAGLAGAKLRFPQTTDSFNTPYIKFFFLDAYGRFISDSPVVNLRMPSVFNISSFSDYSRTEQIVGGGATSQLFSFGKTGLQGLSASAEETVINMAEAINYSLAKGAGNALGFVESAGLSGINQFEFSQRQAVNPMAQLLYKGPQYRKYQVPVPMKPRNQVEAREIQKIIKAFRVASSPSYATSNDQTVGDRTVATALSETSFTFGYPHLVSFNIEFFTDAGNNAATKVLYKSKACTLEAVTVDYGGQKIAFFEDGIPTEMNLTLQMSEVSPRTLGDELKSTEQTGFTIF
jgi:hypothetical protein